MQGMPGRLDDGAECMPLDGDVAGDEHIWIFGYGSLVYRPGFEFAERVEGSIHGVRRVWWQGSTGAVIN